MSWWSEGKKVWPFFGTTQELFLGTAWASFVKYRVYHPSYAWNFWDSTYCQGLFDHLGLRTDHGEEADVRWMSFSCFKSPQYSGWYVLNPRCLCLFWANQELRHGSGCWRFVGRQPYRRGCRGPALETTRWSVGSFQVASCHESFFFFFTLPMYPKLCKTASWARSGRTYVSLDKKWAFAFGSPAMSPISPRWKTKHHSTTAPSHHWQNKHPWELGTWERRNRHVWRLPTPCWQSHHREGGASICNRLGVLTRPEKKWLSKFHRLPIC